MNRSRLDNCIQRHVDSIPTGDISSKTAYSLQSLLLERLKESTQDHVYEWLTKVSTTFTIELPYLQRDWEQYNRISKKTKPMDRDDDEYDDMQVDPNKRVKHVTPKNKEELYMPQKIVTHFNTTIGRYVHNQTGMVFLSKSEPVVFARWDGDSLHPLNEDDVSVCNVFLFKHAPERFYQEMNKMSCSSTASPASASSAAESFSSHGQS